PDRPIPGRRAVGIRAGAGTGAGDPASGAGDGRRRSARSARGQDHLAAAGTDRAGGLPAAGGSRRAQGGARQAGPGNRGGSPIAMVTGRSRRGASSLGCLVSLLIFVAALYYGVHIGEVFFRYYRLVDEMDSQARFATAIDNATIRRRLEAAI